jgi:hypothetical protein
MDDNKRLILMIRPDWILETALIGFSALMVLVISFS